MGTSTRKGQQRENCRQTKTPHRRTERNQARTNEDKKGMHSMNDRTCQNQKTLEISAEEWKQDHFGLFAVTQDKEE
jgi:hypothetical protein